jgi:hypothetical protein
VVFGLNLKKLTAFSIKLFSRLKQEKNSVLCPFRGGLFELIPFETQNLTGHDQALDLLGTVIDVGDLDVPHPFFRQVFSGESHGPQQFAHLVRDEGAVPPAFALGHEDDAVMPLSIIQQALQGRLIGLQGVQSQVFFPFTDCQTRNLTAIQILDIPVWEHLLAANRSKIYANPV